MSNDTKDSNPKDAIGIAKVPWSTIPAQVLGEVGLAMLEGARKYGRSNYRVVGVRASVYYDAVVARHLASWWEGQDIDPDSDISHISKAIADLVILRDSMLQGNWQDDRPPKAANQNWVQDLNQKAKEMLERYPDPKPAYTALNTSVSVVPIEETKKSTLSISLTANADGTFTELGKSTPVAFYSHTRNVTIPAEEVNGPPYPLPPVKPETVSVYNPLTESMEEFVDRHPNIQTNRICTHKGCNAMTSQIYEDGQYRLFCELGHFNQEN